jgi:hypothetical protein
MAVRVRREGSAAIVITRLFIVLALPTERANVFEWNFVSNQIENFPWKPDAVLAVTLEDNLTPNA